MNLDPVSYVAATISPIKIIFTLFALFAWSRAFLQFRNKLMNVKEFSFWSLLWLGLIILIFLPGKTTLMARVLGMNRGLDAMFFIAVVALFYSVYRLYSKSNESEREITALIRKIALKSCQTKNRIKRKKKE